MIYNDFKELSLSRLGFGTMRLPLQEDGSIDQEKVNEMVKYALENGINYFDTAYPYHDGFSEIAIGKALSAYPRDSFNLATKYPGHQASAINTPKKVFEDQLQKCGVDYFDFYLLHNVNDASIKVYMDESNGIMEYFTEQRRLGKIRHLGFSCHANPDNLEVFVEKYGDVLEFCQIQLNYLDWTLQNAEKKYNYLKSRGIPVWVMEPVRGGKLANLHDEDAAVLKAMRPDESVPAWGFRFLQGLDNVKMVLSGMSNLEQMKDNVKTFSSCNNLSSEEMGALMGIADKMKDSVPCTACRYCCAGCPMGLDIPALISLYNQYKFAPDNCMMVSMAIEALPEDKRPSACIGCGQCSHACPQYIDTPEVMHLLADAYEKMPKWSDVCRQREEAMIAAQSRKK